MRLLNMDSVFSSIFETVERKNLLGMASLWKILEQAMGLIREKFQFYIHKRKLF